MPAVTMPAHKKGDFVDYEEKVFEDVKAQPGEKALITFHTVAFEGSIGLVNILQALRLQRKGFKTTAPLYGLGVTLGVPAWLPKAGRRTVSGRAKFWQSADQIHERRRRNLLLPFRAADALRPWRAFAVARHPAHQLSYYVLDLILGTGGTTPSCSTPGRCEDRSTGVRRITA